MSRCAFLLFLSTISTLLLACYLYVPVYSGQKQFSSFGIFLSSSKLIYGIANFGESLGLFSRINFIRRMQQSVPTKPFNDWGLKVEDMDFNGVKVRVYYPPLTESLGKFSGMVFFHGGGYVLGSIDSYNTLVYEMTYQLRNTVVVSVEYRLAPEYRFPVPNEDCLAATRYFLDNVLAFGVDGSRVAVAGDSAGGTLAASVAQTLRQRLKLQILLYPGLQSIDSLTPSYQANSHDPILPRRNSIEFRMWHAFGTLDHVDAMITNDHTSAAIKRRYAATYLDHDIIPKDLIDPEYQVPSLDHGNETIWSLMDNVILDPRFSPLLAEDLSSVPAAYILTCQYDPIRDDGFWYARRLRQAGVKVEHAHKLKGFHGLLSFMQISEEGREALREMVEFVKNNI